MANADKRETIKIGGKLLGFVRKYKKITRIPVGEFIDDAIFEKLDRLPDDVKLQLGVKPEKKKK